MFSSPLAGFASSSSDDSDSGEESVERTERAEESASSDHSTSDGGSEDDDDSDTKEKATASRAESAKLKKKLKNLNSMLDRTRFKLESQKHERTRLETKLDEAEDELATTGTKLKSQNRLIEDMTHELRRLRLLAGPSAKVVAPMFSKSEEAQEEADAGGDPKKKAESSVKSRVNAFQSQIRIHQSELEQKEEMFKQKQKVQKKVLAQKAKERSELAKQLRATMEAKKKAGDEESQVKLQAEMLEQKQAFEAKLREERAAKADLADREKARESEKTVLKEEMEDLRNRLQAAEDESRGRLLQKDQAMERLREDFTEQLQSLTERLFEAETTQENLQEEANTERKKALEFERLDRAQTDELENLRAALNMARMLPNASIEGWLFKLPTSYQGGPVKSASATTSWKRRYFVILRGKNVISYFKTQDSARFPERALKHIRLDQAGTVVGECNTAALEHCFCVTGEAGTLVMAAESERERALWLTALARTQVVTVEHHVNLSDISSKQTPKQNRSMQKGKLVKFAKNGKKKNAKYFELFPDAIMKWGASERAYHEYTHSATVVGVLAGDAAVAAMLSATGTIVPTTSARKFFLLETTGKTLQLLAPGSSEATKWCDAIKSVISTREAEWKVEVKERRETRLTIAEGNPRPSTVRRPPPKTAMTGMLVKLTNVTDPGGSFDRKKSRFGKLASAANLQTKKMMSRRTDADLGRHSRFFVLYPDGAVQWGKNMKALKYREQLVDLQIFAELPPQLVRNILPSEQDRFLCLQTSGKRLMLLAPSVKALQAWSHYAGRVLSAQESVEADNNPNFDPQSRLMSLAR